MLLPLDCGVQAVQKDLLAVVEALHEFCILGGGAKDKVFRMGACSGATSFTAFCGKITPVGPLVGSRESLLKSNCWIPGRIIVHWKRLVT